MEIGTLLNVAYKIISALFNLNNNIEAILAEPDYKFTAIEITMLNAAQTAFRNEFPEVGIPPELQYRTQGSIDKPEFKPKYSLPPSYNANLIRKSLGSNEIALFCSQSINLITDTINELNAECMGIGSSIKVITNKLANYGHVNDAFRMVCVFMIGGFVELSKVSFQNFSELQTASKYLRFIESLDVGALSACVKFPPLKSGKRINQILAEVVKKATLAQNQINEQLAQFTSLAHIQTLSNLAESFISSQFDFYCQVISSTDQESEERIEIDIPNFEEKKTWSPLKAWLEDLALSLALSNKSVKYPTSSAYSQNYVEQYLCFERELLDKEGTFDEWPALLNLDSLKKDPSGLYKRAGECYQVYCTLGRRLYLMSLLRSCLYYFKQLVVSKGEQVLQNREARQLIENVLKQMELLVRSINGITQQIVDWGTTYRNQLLRSSTSPFLEDEIWIKNFNSSKEALNNTSLLLQHLDYFQKALPVSSMSSPSLGSFDGHRIIKVVEIVNAQLNPQGQRIFASVEVEDEAQEDDAYEDTEEMEVPPIIERVRSWIRLFRTHQNQQDFLKLWKEICYLNVPLSSGTLFILEKKQGYLKVLQNNLGSVKEREHKWAADSIKTLARLNNQPNELTCTEVIQGYLRSNQNQLSEHVNSRFTADETTLEKQAIRLICLLPRGHGLPLDDAQDYVKIFHDCCFPRGFSYDEQRNLDAEPVVNRALKIGLNTLLGETLTAWKSSFTQPNGQSSYYQLIAEGLVRLGANPLEWLEANGETLKDLMDQSEFNPLFAFFSAQTKVFLYFIQYYAAYLGQTFTHLNQAWEPFIQAIDAFSLRLKRCIDTDKELWWRMTQDIIGLIGKLPLAFSRDAMWDNDKFLGARKERFTIWLALIVWVYQLLNEALIDITQEPNSATAQHEVRITNAMNAYSQRIPDKQTNWNPFNEGFASFKELSRAWGGLKCAVVNIENERRTYLESREDNRTIRALQQTARVACADAATARTEVVAVRTEVDTARAKTDATTKVMVEYMLGVSLSAVRERANPPRNRDELKGMVIDFIYSTPQHNVLLTKLAEANWTKATLMGALEELLTKERELNKQNKGKEEMIESPKERQSPEASRHSGSYAPQFFDERPATSSSSSSSSASTNKGRDYV